MSRRHQFNHYAGGSDRYEKSTGPAFQSIADELKPELLGRRMQQAGAWAAGPGWSIASAVGSRALRVLSVNLSPRRIFSFPHVLVLLWGVVLLWGEQWVFQSKVDSCDWNHWEQWPKGATPHHLIFIADPQITDPHSYPGRSWPLAPLTVLITDNYLRRGAQAIQRQLHPDSLFFLGDLFDGGREWKTSQGQFVDPKWGFDRASNERGWVDTWHRKYGDNYWLREYRRFGDIFFKHFGDSGGEAGMWQRGRKLVASLPGNHDLGFGAQIQVPVRDRFSAFFGDVNRVDVVGNHTIVSVDTVSLSADTSKFKDAHDLKPIYGPVNEFLDGVQAAKRRAVRNELNFWHGEEQNVRFEHEVQELDDADLSRFPHADVSPEAPDLPTILLTHVPLYRDPGTPCGPRREHSPPKKPARGQEGPVVPDPDNAISVSAGYQYQNVLSEEDSVKLVKSVGNVVHVFSGDDHDYCELKHSEAKGGVREITVKSMGMNMGVSLPGFLMVSLYNPVDAAGKPVAGAPEATLQTHLCLLPNQIHTYMMYVVLVVASLVLLTVRALLVPVLGLTPFALEPDHHRGAGGAGGVLPMYQNKKDKKFDPPTESFGVGAGGRSTSAAGSSAHYLPSRLSSTAAPRGAGRATSPGPGLGPGPAPRWKSRRSGAGAGVGGGSGGQGKRWGWGGADGPRIHLDSFDDSAAKEERRVGGRNVIGLVGRELWTTTWRVAWMVMLYWVYLSWED